MQVVNKQGFTKIDDDLCVVAMLKNSELQANPTQSQ